MVERCYFVLGLASAGFGNIVRGCWALMLVEMYTTVTQGLQRIEDLQSVSSAFLKNKMRPMHLNRLLPVESSYGWAGKLCPAR